MLYIETARIVLDSSLLTLSCADSAFALPDVSVFFSNYQAGMSEERYFYLYNLNEHTKKVKTAFAGLVFELQKYLEQNSSVQEVLNLLNLALAEQLNCYKTILEIFHKIVNYFSFFDYELIKLLIRHLGSKYLQKKKMKKYEKMFYEYSKRRVVECPNDAFGENTTVLK